MKETERAATGKDVVDHRKGCMPLMEQVTLFDLKYQCTKILNKDLDDFHSIKNEI